MATNETAITKPSANDLRSFFASETFKQQVALALPKHMTPDRFCRVALNAFLRTPKLLDCSRESLLKAFMDLSALGLEPDGRRAHLIPFGREVTLIIDYKGLVECVRRSGDVSYIHADVVYSNDQFHCAQGSGARLEHTKVFGDRGKPIAAYSFVRLKDGSESFEVLSIEEVDNIRKRSKAANNGPWVTDYDEMAKKTAFRRHSKWLPFSSEARDVIERDDEIIDVSAVPQFIEPQELEAGDDA